ncbi:MAG: transposase [Pseudomonadota bacterium]|nr:transposase [Pseudomonadota bacterium]
MKYSKAEVHCKTHGLPALRFEDSQLTSFSGLVLLQALVAHLGLKERLRRCFGHLTVSPIFGHTTLVLCLVLHLMLGYRRLGDLRYYSDDPLVMRTLGLRRLPDVATLSRGLARADAESVKHLQGLVREGVVTRLVALGLARVTLDFDGSVIGTGKGAEGTAVGFNRKKKGPLRSSLDEQLNSHNTTLTMPCHLCMLEPTQHFSREAAHQCPIDETVT